jgi:nitric-oxide synthase, bacterial
MLATPETGSVTTAPSGCPVAAATRRTAALSEPARSAQSGPDTAEPAELAADFLSQLRHERGTQGPSDARILQVAASLTAEGSYWHTDDELTWGARIAWRNTPRCVGKFYWKALAVRDMRHLRTSEQIFQALVEHLRLSFNGGRVKLILTVFAPQRPGSPGIRIWNSQLIRYAGYRNPDGTVTGDPDNVGITAALQRLGWSGPGGRFDPLPVVIQMPGQEPRWFELPRDVIPEVHITHPDYPKIGELGLKWHAFPSISDQRLEIGGVNYTAAPFSAWYSPGEVGGRNLSDTNRYDMLPDVARALDLDTSSERTLWRDEAQLELVRAVLHSFDEAKVSIIDHHFASRQFVRHEERERAAGRITPANWAQIIPPISGSTSPLWHGTYDAPILHPNFFPQSAPCAPAESLDRVPPAHPR